MVVSLDSHISLVSCHNATTCYSKHPLEKVVTSSELRRWSALSPWRKKKRYHLLARHDHGLTLHSISNGCYLDIETDGYVAK